MCFSCWFSVRTLSRGSLPVKIVLMFCSSILYIRQFFSSKVYSQFLSVVSKGSVPWLSFQSLIAVVKPIFWRVNILFIKGGVGLECFIQLPPIWLCVALIYTVQECSSGSSRIWFNAMVEYDASRKFLGRAVICYTPMYLLVICRMYAHYGGYLITVIKSPYSTRKIQNNHICVFLGWNHYPV